MLVFYLAALDSDDNKNKFETIYRKYYRFMLHTAAGIIKNPTLAEDAVHETFVQLLRGPTTKAWPRPWTITLSRRKWR